MRFEIVFGQVRIFSCFNLTVMPGSAKVKFRAPGGLLTRMANIMGVYRPAISRSSATKVIAEARPAHAVIAGVANVWFDVHADVRGSLIAHDPTQSLPFDIKRVFYIFDVPAGLARGNHSVSSDLLLTAPRGAVTIACNNGHATISVRLADAAHGLHLEPGVMVTMSDFTADALLLVASSQTYGEVRYFDKPIYPMPRTR